MAVIVGTNSYGDEAGLTAYAAARGYTIEEDPSALLIRAMDYLEQKDYKGYKTDVNQPLQWPRTGVTVDRRVVGVDEIPTLLIEAQYETAIATDQGNDPLATIDRATSSEKVDVIEVTYTNSASSTNIVRTINNKLRKLLRSGMGGNFVNLYRV